MSLGIKVGVYTCVNICAPEGIESSFKFFHGLSKRKLMISLPHTALNFPHKYPKQTWGGGGGGTSRCQGNCRCE